MHLDYFVCNHISPCSTSQNQQQVLFCPLNNAPYSMTRKLLQSLCAVRTNNIQIKFIRLLNVRQAKPANTRKYGIFIKGLLKGSSQKHPSSDFSCQKTYVLKSGFRWLIGSLEIYQPKPWQYFDMRVLRCKRSGFSAK